MFVFVLFVKFKVWWIWRGEICLRYFYCDMGVFLKFNVFVFGNGVGGLLEWIGIFCFESLVKVVFGKDFWFVENKFCFWEFIWLWKEFIFVDFKWCDVLCDCWGMYFVLVVNFFLKCFFDFWLDLGFWSLIWLVGKCFVVVELDCCRVMLFFIKEGFGNDG